MDIKGYWQKTLVQAQNALTVFPLKAKVAPFTGINTLFPFIENPTPLQQKVLDLDISQPVATVIYSGRCDWRR